MLYEKEVKMLPAQTLQVLLGSIEKGCFSKNGNGLSVGDFNVKDKNISSLSGAPKEVAYDFDCSYNPDLETLKGGPEKVGGDYNCANNPKLKSLEGAPKEMHANFWCFNNPKLKNLEGAPEKIGGDFNFSNLSLRSLKGAPKIVGRDFYWSIAKVTLSAKVTSLDCKGITVGRDFYWSIAKVTSSAKVTSLDCKGITVGRDFYCNDNNLESLEGVPQKVDGSFYCNNNHLTSLESIHMHVLEIGQTADFRENPINSHVLGLLKIKGLKEVKLDHKKVQEIINKYLHQGGKDPSLRDIVDCQEELMDNDLEDYGLL